MAIDSYFFDEHYYQKIILSFGYNPFEFEALEFALGGLSCEELRYRFLCSHNAKQFESTPKKKRAIVTGFGMSGVPHIGSISQVMRMMRFASQGENCEIVLGDLDAYNGRNIDLSRAKELACRFEEFIRKLGYSNQIRKQLSSPEHLKNMYLLSRYSTEENLEFYEEDIHEVYSKLGIVSEKFTFSRRASLLLMTSDFITLGQQYDSVMGVLGIDEHKYFLYAKVIKERVMDDECGMRKEFGLSAVYNRLNPGFLGFPKMSKSFPESGIGVEDSPDKISKLILSEVDPLNASQSLNLQLLIQTHTWSSLDIRDAIIDYKIPSKWKARKYELIDRLIEFTSLW